MYSGKWPGKNPQHSANPKRPDGRIQDYLRSVSQTGNPVPMFSVSPGIPIGPATVTSLVPIITWTTIPALAAGDLEYYVDSSRPNDTGNGLTPATAKKTLAAGYGLLRDGTGDRLYLKRGQTWTDEVISSSWAKSGVSVARPLIVASYGSGAKPEIKTGLNRVVDLNTSTVVHDVWFMDFNAWQHSYDGTPGNANNLLNWVTGNAFGGYNVLFENLSLHDCGSFNLAIMGGNVEGSVQLVNVQVRGCTIYRSYKSDTTASTVGGIYAFNNNGLLIEWNNCDTNGWILPQYQVDQRRHMYIDNVNVNVTVRYNWMIGCDSIQLRCGGNFYWNASSNVTTGFQVGGGTIPNPGGVIAVAEDNVALALQDASAGSGVNCLGVSLSNIVGGSIQRNIFANAQNAVDAIGLWFRNSSVTTVCMNTTISNNIWHNTGAFCLYFQTNQQSDAYSANTFSNNVMQNPTNPNTFYTANKPIIFHGAVTAAGGAPLPLDGSDFTLSNNSFGQYPTGVALNAVLYNGAPNNSSIAAWAALFGANTGTVTGFVTYPFPNRSVASFSGVLGGTATLAAFITDQRAMERTNWNNSRTAPAFVQYIKQGFGVG